MMFKGRMSSGFELLDPEILPVFKKRNYQIAFGKCDNCEDLSEHLGQEGPNWLCEECRIEISERGG